MDEVKEKALHIYRMGEGSVRNEDVEAILETLNNELGGYWGAGVSNGEITWLEQVV